MSDLGSITRCRDISDELLDAAIEARDDTRALFERAVEIGKPREAGARVLLLFARMASPACDWLEGALRVELTADGDNTVIESVVDIGAGLKERVFPKRTMNVPLDEFASAIRKFPQAIAPMTAESLHPAKVVLLAPEAERIIDESVPPPPGYSPEPPTLSGRKATHPPDAATHTPAMVVGAAGSAYLPLMNTALAEEPIAPPTPAPPAKPLAKLKLRKSSIARGVSEEVAPRREFVDASVKRPPRPVAPPPFLAEPPAKREVEPKPSEAAPKTDEVDNSWDE